MKKTSMKNQTKIVDDNCIHYRLYCIRDQKGTTFYQLQCIFRDELLTCPLAITDVKLAHKIYNQIVQGKVTPCSMIEVLKDLCS